MAVQREHKKRLLKSYYQCLVRGTFMATDKRKHPVENVPESDHLRKLKLDRLQGAANVAYT